MKLPLYLSSLLASSALAAQAPDIVATPPVDGGRGLVRVSDTEIRHYPGKNAKKMLVSLDNGETWSYQPLPTSYPLATCTGKEAPSIARNPNTGEFLRVEKTYNRKNASDGLYITDGGLDGTWNLVTDKDGNGIKLGGLHRTPTWVNNNKRVLIPGHGGGCWTWYSDDQGLSWQRSNKVNSPKHEPGGVHKGYRWNHGMVEATVIELKNNKLWMVGRTSQDQHYQSFSDDFGTTWSKAEPSRFWGTITMPTFHRLKDGRILFLWSNTTSLPENEKATGRGEDAFTNRDSIHAAISEDEGETWIGFRELILDEHRNRSDYGTFNGSQDRGKHQAEVVQLDDKRVLFSCGQHKEHRRLMIMDIDWLYEKERSSDISKDGTRDWSTHQYIYKKVGHCAYNRTAGAQVEDGALRLRRVAETNLTNPNQGAVWNFPAGDTGRLTTKVRLEKGGAGLQVALTDRWFNATDHSVDQFANYVLKIDAEGKTPEGKRLLTPGKTHELAITWRNVGKKGKATLSLDGRKTNITLPCINATPNGISYVHFYNPATETDDNGSSILHVKARVK